MSESKGVEAVLGVDVSKGKFNVALLRAKKYRHKSFPNNSGGFTKLDEWLRRQGVEEVHACMEATGVYGEELAEYLYECGHRVSVVNPARIKGFAQSELVRTKTDKVDASVIARFCVAIGPEVWTPESNNVRELRSLARRVDALVKMKNQESNRLDVSSTMVKADIEEHIEYLDKQIDVIKQRIKTHIDQNPDLKEKRKLLESIPGVGEATIRLVLSHFADIQKFSSAKELASFLGIAPTERSSGSSVRGGRKMSKVGRSSLRKAFYMPALSAMQYNPIIIRMKRRLTEAGKPGMVIVGAAMRKLVHLIYGVLKNEIPFDSDYVAKYH